MIMKKQDKAIPAMELSVFCGQVALLLESGLPLYEGMETLANMDADSPHADLYRALSNGVTETGSLYEALKRDDRWPSYLVEMTGTGERSGKLEEVMRGLEAYYAREDRIRSAAVSAITYPLFLGAMLVVIVLVLMWKVLPLFRRVLNSMGMGIGSSGNTLMRIGTATGWVVLVLVGIAVLAAAIGIVLTRTRYRKRVLALTRTVFPAIHQLDRKLCGSRVAGVLSMMISAGFPIDEALEVAASVLPDQQVVENVEKIRTELSKGGSFADAISSIGIFEDLDIQMLRMGIATGREDQVLAKLSALYEEQTEDAIARLLSIIEPSLVALLSVVIGAILLSVMLPMAGVLSSL